MKQTESLTADDTQRTIPYHLIRKPRKTVLVSIVVSAVALAGLALVLLLGGGVAAVTPTGHPAPHAAGAVAQPWFRVFVAIVVIGGAAHLGGAAVRRLGQPAVIGEIAVGIVLGPSVLGAVSPELSALVLPQAIRPSIELLAQVGLVLFMFSVGLEFDSSKLRGQGIAIGALGQATMVVPFALGVAVAPLLSATLAGPTADSLSFPIFIGTAMSITAFPVLARIVLETGLSGTKLGSLAMLSAAIDDVLAWCALAVVLVLIQAGDPLQTLWTLGLSLLFIVVLFGAVRPGLQALVRRYDHLKISRAGRIAMVAGLVFLMAQITDWIGVHAIFGAFLAGLVLPKDSRLLGSVPEEIGSVNRALLLPVFFASVGLNTDLVVAISHPAVLAAGALALAVAVLGKLGGTTVVARASGSSWRTSLGLGVLLNARGITEIVVLRAGLDAGVINKDAFTVLVVMALVTTVMAAPALHLLKLARPARRRPEGGEPSAVTKDLAAAGRFPAQGRRTVPHDARDKGMEDKETA